jgi:hypothetical protein
VGRRVLADPGFQRFMLGGHMMDTIERREMWTHGIVTIKPLASSAILTNNLSVAFAAFAMGVTAGLGTAWIMVLNGLLIGVIGTACFRAGLSLSSGLRRPAGRSSCLRFHRRARADFDRGLLDQGRPRREGSPAATAPSASCRVSRCCHPRRIEFHHRGAAACAEVRVSAACWCCWSCICARAGAGRPVPDLEVAVDEATAARAANLEHGALRRRPQQDTAAVRVSCAAI